MTKDDVVATIRKAGLRVDDDSCVKRYGTIMQVNAKAGGISVFVTHNNAPVDSHSDWKVRVENNGVEGSGWGEELHRAIKSAIRHLDFQREGALATIEHTQKACAAMEEARSALMVVDGDEVMTYEKFCAIVLARWPKARTSSWGDLRRCVAYLDCADVVYYLGDQRPWVCGVHAGPRKSGETLDEALKEVRADLIRQRDNIDSALVELVGKTGDGQGED